MLREFTLLSLIVWLFCYLFGDEYSTLVVICGPSLSVEKFPAYANEAKITGNVCKQLNPFLQYSTNMCMNSITDLTNSQIIENSKKYRSSRKIARVFPRNSCSSFHSSHLDRSRCRSNSLRNVSKSERSKSHSSLSSVKKDPIYVVHARPKSIGLEPLQFSHESTTDELTSEKPTTACERNDSLPIITGEEIAKNDVKSTVPDFHVGLESDEKELKTVAANFQISENQEQDITTSVKLESGIQRATLKKQEEIPSFREWAEKHLEEQEKGKGEVNSSVVSNGIAVKKMRNKNYASLDCGAKVIATNPEAIQAGSLLSRSSDEYFLSPCNARTWFVVELCESVQIKRIELANIELFSSSFREFIISTSDRFPSRDWMNAGQYVARDSKILQSFELKHDHFAKFVRIEILSHYGSEHFCPLSIFNVYGTSEMEVLETVDAVHEIGGTEYDEDDEPVITHSQSLNQNKADKNIFGTAKDAVINIVRKAANALSKMPGHQDDNGTLSHRTQQQSDILPTIECSQRITPKFDLICQNCSADLKRAFYEVVSCQSHILHALYKMPNIKFCLKRRNYCDRFGFFASIRESPYRCDSLLDWIAEKFVAGICYLAAVEVHKLPVTFGNVENDGLKLEKVTANASVNFSNAVLSDTEPQLETKESAATLYPSINEPDVSRFAYDPTKTLDNVDIIAPLDMTGVNRTPTIADISPTEAKESSIRLTAEAQKPEYSDAKEGDVMEDSASFDSIISELEQTEGGSSNSVTSNSKPQIQKESVFVRLANRIKALERNMSLSGQYLEELSRRYKKQVEEMQRVLNEALIEKRKSESREEQRLYEINGLATQVAVLSIAVENLQIERNSWTFYAICVAVLEHSALAAIELAIIFGLLFLIRGIPRLQLSRRRLSLEWQNFDGNATTGRTLKRGHSLNEADGQPDGRNLKKRPSVQALRVDGATHQKLLITSDVITQGGRKRLRKKRRELLLKSTANALNLEAGQMVENDGARKNEILQNPPLSRSASALELASWPQQNGFANEIVIPSYMRTATSVREQRKKSTLLPETNGKPSHIPEEEASSSATPSKSYKRVNSFKKMVKKMF